MLNRIHFVHLSAGPGGIEVLLPVQVEKMPDFNFKAFVIRGKEDGTNVYDNTGIEVKYGHQRNLQAAFRLFNYVLRNRNEIFHVFNIGPFFLLIMKLAGAQKIIYSIHGTIYWKSPYKKKVLLFLWKLALSAKYKFTANSEYSKSVFSEKIDAKQPIQILYNPIDGKRFTPKDDKKTSDEILVVYTGRLSPGKNLLLWIDIAAEIHSKIPRTRFEIYGKGQLESKLRSKISELNAEGYIHLMGFQKGIENIYRKADLLLFLSEYESFGNVVVECIYCGTPVLASPLPVMKEIFSEFPGFVLGEQNCWVDQVYNGLVHLNELKKLSLKARTNFLVRFDQQENLNKLAKIYTSFE
jgi:glycosyltransferase involved in cell wall biosynthesis